MKTETTTTIKLPNETLLKIKGLALEKRTTQSQIIKEFINKGLSKTEKEDTGKVKARVINKDMSGYDPKYEGSLKNIIGIVEVDKPEDIDIQELKDSIHYKKELY